MNSLERSYRLLLAIYPAQYLEQREEEMVTTLLASAPAHQRRPAMREALGLLRSGLSVRAATYGRTERTKARAWAGLVSAGALSALVTLVFVVHVKGTWPTARPPLFAPIWLIVGALPLLYVCAPRVVRRWGWLLVVVAVVGVVRGPSTMLASRTLLVAIVWFAVLVWVAPAVSRRSLRAGVVLAGIGVGLAGAAKVHSVLDFNRLSYRRYAPAHEEWILHTVFQDLPSLIAWLWIPSLCILAIAGFTRGTIAITFGYVVAPIGLAMTALSLRLNNPTMWGLPVAVEVMMVSICSATLAATCGAVATMRPRRESCR